MAKPLHTIAYTAGFLAQAKADGMTEAEMEAMERMLAANPDAGEMIVGSGGCRKVRVAGKGRSRQLLGRGSGGHGGHGDLRQEDRRRDEGPRP